MKKSRVKPKKDKGTAEALKEYRRKFAEEYEDILRDAEEELESPDPVDAAINLMKKVKEKKINDD